VLHHVGIEVVPEDVEAAVEFFETLGFKHVEPPPTLRRYTWLEREGTQIHLMPETEPTVPSPGHLAVVVDDHAATLERLRERGFKLEEKGNHWGSRRTIAFAPGGHRVELMEFPPAPSA
jgi:predicted enzyme related to lactoylglutathione lyase